MARRLSVSLKLWFNQRYDNLPSGLQARVKECFLTPDLAPGLWDSLTPEQREAMTEFWDEVHPIDANREEAEAVFREGFKSVSIPQRNRKNSKKPRCSRQKVSDHDIRDLKSKLDSEGIKPHRRCSEAYRRLNPPISIQAFRRRWNRS